MRQRPASRPLGLVYRGPAAFAECSEAVAGLLRNSTSDFDVRYVGPHEKIKISPAALRSAALYAQPGGGSLNKAYRKMKGTADIIRDYVSSGGRYVGFCLGGYLAGRSPGFNLLPGDTDQFITSPGAGVTQEVDTVVDVYWRGHLRRMYFQDGPYFQLDTESENVIVLATYANGRIAAMVTPFGQGKVGVVGPHPEATAGWYEDYGLTNPDGIDTELGCELIETLMQP